MTLGHQIVLLLGTTLESKGMREIVQKKCKINV